MIQISKLSLWGRTLQLFMAVMLCSVENPVSAESDSDLEPAAVVVELAPGENPPPFVQLDKDTPPVPWDAATVSDFSLLDQNNEPITKEMLLGEQWVANFVFARCTFQCPMTCRKVMELNQELKNVPVRFVTITVDPEHDTVPYMREFADIWGAKAPRWRFVTGDPAQVLELIRTGFKEPAWENLGESRRAGMEFAHSDNFIHVGADGKILGRYSGLADAELVTLRRVIKGEIKTPQRFQPATFASIAALEARKVNAQKEAGALADPEEKPTKEAVLARLPGWAQRLPATNAMLNSLATCLLLLGYSAAKFRRYHLHKRLMLLAFGVSVAFLATYLSYHWALHEYGKVRGMPFTGTGTFKLVYYSILISHVILAAAVPVLAIITILNGRKAYPDGISAEEAVERVQERRVHRRWAWVTFPVWLYVSITGVLIYWMLYKM
ncbi:DUF420 domain-containing protein [Planctomicrobium sp. SH668]|uniref:DUF420 domain-containing protein n=1 Tax=Planctomicrobium sp. SH668 TaxID=3448126 RepID=UPI003F5C828F